MMARNIAHHLTLGMVAVAVVGGVLFLPPRMWHSPFELRVGEGATVKEVTNALAHQGLIVSAVLLEGVWRVVGKGKAIAYEGRYRLTPQGVLPLALALSRPSQDAWVRVTFPEGAASYEMAAILRRSLPSFESARFERLAAQYEGYLFPDTYLVSPATTPEELITRMRATFQRRIAPLRARIASSSHTLHEIVTIASLLEKEGRTSRERRLIAGVIENRLRLGMPLQIDATIGYLLRRPVHRPSVRLTAIESPYNTYQVTGLPPGPIGNPGLAAIEDALAPTDSEYLYYLTGDDGITRFSRTFEEHRRLKERYLH